MLVAALMDDMISIRRCGEPLRVLTVRIVYGCALMAFLPLEVPLIRGLDETPVLLAGILCKPQASLDTRPTHP